MLRQQELLYKFNELIKNKDDVGLVEIIDQLGTLPDELSPIRALALKSDNQAIELFIKAAKTKLLLDAKKACITQFDSKMDQIKNDESTNFTHTPVEFKVKVEITASSFISLMQPIYRNAIYSYASNNRVFKIGGILKECHNVINFKEDNVKDKVAKEFLFRIYESATEGYLQGRHYNEIAILWKKYIHAVHIEENPVEELDAYLEGLVQRLIIVGQYDVVLEILKEWQTKAALTATLNVFDEKGLLERLLLLWENTQQQLKKEIAPIVLKCLAKAGKIESVTEILKMHFVRREGDAAIEGYQLGGFYFESNKIKAIYNLFERVMSIVQDRLKTQSTKSVKATIPNIIFNLICEVSDNDLKKVLFIECLYKKSLLGKEFWWMNKESPMPTLKRGVLNNIVAKLEEMDVDIAALPGCEAYSHTFLRKTYPSKKTLFYVWPHSPVTERSNVFTVKPGSNKDQVVDDLFNELKKAHLGENDNARPQKLLELIKKLDNKVELKISLLIDCIYKTTRLGKTFWEVNWPHSTLKRGVLNQVVEELKILKVDLVKLPGFGTYSPGMFSVSTTYPSKVHLEGLNPPSDVPMLKAPVKANIKFADDTDSETEENELVSNESSLFQL